MKIQNLIIRILFFIVILASAGCTDDEIIPREYPRLETLEVTNISDSGATFNARIILLGNQDIIEYGFVWHPDYGFPHVEPTLGSNRIFLTEGITEGDFSANITTTLYKNRIYSVKAFAKTEEYTVYGKNIEFKSLGSRAAIFEDFTPKIGAWGDTINIKGKNFSYLPEYNQIFFEDIESKVISSTDSTINCIVPENITEKKVPIFLLLAGHKSNSNELFELALPKIESFSPLKGTFNDTIELIGENFSPIKNKNIVSFDGHQAEVVASTKTTLSVIVPTSLNTQWNKIEIVLNLQSDTAKELFEILAPKIDGFSPEYGTSNTLIKITGNNFSPIRQDNTIIFDSNFGEVIEASTKELTVKIPFGNYTNRFFEIGVTVAGQTTYTASMFNLRIPWLKRKDVPPDGFNKTKATAFSLLNMGYVGLGLGNSSENANHDFYRYHPVHNTWEKITDFGGEGRYNATSFVIGNYAYVGTGSISYYDVDKTNDFWRFDPITEDWTEIANFPISTSGAKGLSVNGKGYIFIDNYVDNFWSYDPSIDKWFKMPDLDMSNVGVGTHSLTGFVIEDKIYICISSGSSYTFIYEFDTNTLQWTKKAGLNYPGTSASVTLVGFSIENKGYIMGSKSLFEYDPQSNSWKELSDFPGDYRRSPVAFELDGKSYYGTGYAKHDLWEFNPEYE